MPRPHKPRPPSSVNGLPLELYREFGYSDEEIIHIAEQAALESAPPPPPSTPFERRAAELAEEARNFPDIPWTDPAASTSAEASAFSAERFALDDSPPSPGVLRRFYALAAQVWLAKPWQRLIEDKVLAVRLPGGRLRFFTVIGFRAARPALLVFPDFPSAAVFHRCGHSSLPFLLPVASRSVWHWGLSFLAPDDLFDGELADLRAHASFDFPPVRKPSAFSIAPGFDQARCGGAELGGLCDAIQAFLPVLRHRALHAVAIPDFSDPAPAVALWEPIGDSARWRLSAARFSQALSCPLNLPRDLLSAVLALPVLPDQHIAVSEVVGPEAKPGVARNFASRLLVFSNENLSGFLTETLLTQPGRPFRLSDSLAAIARHFVSEGALPGTLSGLGGILTPVLRRFAALLAPRSVRFDPSYHSPALLDATARTQAGLL